MEGKKLTDKLKEGKYKGQTFAQVIETDPNFITDQMENYGLLLEDCAYAFYVYHMERVNDELLGCMY